jgi:zinc D-Ala-D-Ala carboxypeptidase
MNQAVTKNFAQEEFVCRCGCGTYNMRSEVITALQKARDLAEIPSKVASGSRCAPHNRKVGGKSDSAHLDGLAVDVVAYDSRTRAKVIRSRSPLASSASG